jgi:hypothetical protein
VPATACQLAAASGPSGPTWLGAAALARREGPAAQAVRRAQSIYLDEINDALLVEADGGEPRSRVLLEVLESLCHALRAWVAYGHAPVAIAGYYADGALGAEHARAAELVAQLAAEYARQAETSEVGE